MCLINFSNIAKDCNEKAFLNFIPNEFRTKDTTQGNYNPLGPLRILLSGNYIKLKAIRFYICIKNDAENYLLMYNLANWDLYTWNSYKTASFDKCNLTEEIKELFGKDKVILAFETQSKAFFFKIPIDDNAATSIIKNVFKKISEVAAFSTYIN